jgi:gamma-glutamyltranspeptidase/glutathione hydrolase
MVESATFRAKRAEVIGNFGVVSATHWIPAQVAMGVLERGGTAFDAVVAGGLVFHVVDPDMSGFGGELVALVKPTTQAEPTVVCGQGVAPSRATIAHYLAEGFDFVPGAGVMAAVVPGAFDAWMLLLRDYGTMRLADVVTPAIHYAAAGFPLTVDAATRLGKFAAKMREWPATAEIYLKENGPPAAGQLIVNRPLARCLQRLLDEAVGRARGRERQIDAARDVYYRGFITEEIDGFVRRYREPDASGQPRHRGLIEASDLSRWRATIEEPCVYDYHGVRVFKPGPWAQSPVFLQSLALLQRLPFGEMDPLGADSVHLQTEAFKLAFADREAWYGDPDFVDVPMRSLLDEDYNARRRALIGATASIELRPGDLACGRASLPRHPIGEVKRPGRPAAASSHQKDTCHINVIDRWHNVVSATASGGWVQDSPVIPALGFSLSTRGQMFWLQEGLASGLAPRKRPRTTLSPTMAFLPDGTAVAFGCRGADHSDQWLVQFLLWLVHGRTDLQTAVDAPVFASEHWPSSMYPRRALPGRLLIDRTFGEPVAAELKGRGHDVRLKPEDALGRTCAAACKGNLLRAAATGRLPQFAAIGR